MVAVARATSAAPTFFPPQAIDLVRGGAPGQCIDGGVWANNPVILGYHRGLRLASDRGLPANHVVVVSLGTGAAAVEGGALAPSRTWLGSLTGLAANATDTHIQDFVMAYHHDGRGPRRYWRFQTFEAGAAGAMDDPTPERLDMLTRAAHALVESSRREFDAVADVLRR
jgi:hypothetical protein